MNILCHACSAARVSKSCCLVGSHSICIFSALPWNVKFSRIGIRSGDIKSFSGSVFVRSYSSANSRKNGSQSQKAGLAAAKAMDEEKDTFFVVRKGDLIGIYKSLSDCQSQVGSSICDPPVSVYKGYSMPKSTKDYLKSRGIENALYSLRAQDLIGNLFGTLFPCPLQPPPTSGISNEQLQQKVSHEAVCSETELPPRSCTLEFDGASKGNGQAGAGAVLRADDGSLICRLREGLGAATCNVAEYRAMILGLNYALSKGYTSIRVQGDSKLVCKQIQGGFKVKSNNLSNVYARAKHLKDMFRSFEINHVLREFNSDADKQANLAVALPDGHIQEEIEKSYYTGDSHDQNPFIHCSNAQQEEL
ncbi:unnamed protein product [Cuscuta campestris]|uniref:RNase H type-1 domain-containing protein n=1 Tax=Cuscuta campestris TaxID=132261 RepID=A0A484MG32_9ASTE|nr:unnamed protein product [Cuscuta campestris]